MQIDTLKFIVKNSNTMQELQQAEKMLREKKSWLRKIPLQHSEDLRSILFPKEDVKLDLKHVEEALERLNSAPQNVQDELLMSVKDVQDIEKMIRTVEEMQQIVTKKMKDIIWNNFDKHNKE